MSGKLFAVPAALAAAVGLALAGAGIASADPRGTELGGTQELHDGGVTIAYTVEELEPADDTVTNVVLHGELWEVDLEIEAVEGTVTPVIPFFNARTDDGQNYPALFTAIGDEAVSGATLAQGEESEGNIYFDVTGAEPTHIVYNDGVQDRLIWKD